MKTLRQLYLTLRAGIERYAVAFFASCALFIFTAAQIFIDPSSGNDIIIRLLFSSLFAAVISVAAQAASVKYHFSPILNLAQKIISALAAVPCFFLTAGLEDNEYIIIGYFGITAAAALAAVYFLFSDKNETRVTAHLVKSALFAGFFGLIFFAGVTLCLFAVYYLIYEINNLHRYIFTALAFAYEILALNLFLSLLPEPEDEISVPKAFKIIVLYAAFPVYLALLAVLYIYLGKIAVTLIMPGGQINLFASFAELFFVFFRFTLAQYENRAAKLFIRFGGYLMLPVMAAQVAAVYIRLDAYGLTTARCASLYMNLAALVFVILALIRGGKYIRIFPLTLAAIAILASVTPLNIIDLPVRDQTARLERVLIANGMLSDGAVTANPSITEEDKDRIRSSYHYLIYQRNVPDFIDKNAPFGDVFGFEEYSLTTPEGTKTVYLSGILPNELDISAYSTMYYIDKGEDSGRCVITAGKAEYDLTAYLESLKGDISKNEPRTLNYSPADGADIYFTQINCGLSSDGALKNYYISCYIFVK